MQCNVIATDNQNAFNIVAGGVQDSTLTSYIQAGMQNSLGVLKTMGADVYNQASTMFNRFSSDSAVNKAKQLLIENNIGDTSIETIFYNGGSNFTKLSYITKIYAMANPKMRKARDMGLINGYADEIIEFEPDTESTDRIEYMEVMDGMWYETPGEKEDECYSYWNSYRDNTLTVGEQLNIKSLWDDMETEMNNDDFVDMTQD